MKHGSCEAGKEGPSDDTARRPAVGRPEREAPLLVETTPEGAILLKPAAVYPVEVYSEQRVAEFERENAVPEDLQAKVRALLGRDI